MDEYLTEELKAFETFSEKYPIFKGYTELTTENVIGEYIETKTESSGKVGDTQIVFSFFPKYSSGQLVKDFEVVSEAKIKKVQIFSENDYLITTGYNLPLDDVVVPYTKQGIEYRVEFESVPEKMVILKYDIYEYTFSKDELAVLKLEQWQKSVNGFNFKFDFPITCLVCVHEKVINEFELSFLKQTSENVENIGLENEPSYLSFKEEERLTIKLTCSKEDDGKVVNVYELPNPLNMNNFDMVCAIIEDHSSFEKVYARNLNTLKCCDEMISLGYVV